MAIAKRIATNLKPSSDGDFVKNCVIDAVESVCPKSVEDFKRISLSRNTISRKVKELACNIEGTSKEKLHGYIFHALAIDERTDQSDTAQQAIFVCDVDDHFNVFEGLSALSSLKGQTRGIDILQALRNVMERNGLNLENLAGSNGWSPVYDWQELRVNCTFKERG